MGIWVTVAVTFKVAVNATAEQRVFVRRRCRQWTRTGYHRCHTEWRGHHPVPDSTSPQQQWSAPGAPGSHLAPGTWHKTSVKSSDTLNCDPAKKKLCDHWVTWCKQEHGKWDENCEVRKQMRFSNNGLSSVTMVRTSPAQWSARPHCPDDQHGNRPHARLRQRRLLRIQADDQPSSQWARVSQASRIKSLCNYILTASPPWPSSIALFWKHCKLAWFQITSDSSRVPFLKNHP